jgi:hypothetical protein
MHHIHQFVSRRITGSFERGDFIAEVSFKLALRPEGDFPDARMKPVRSNHEIEFASATGGEFNLDAIWFLLDCRNAIIEECLDSIFNLFVDEGRQLSSGNADVAAIRNPGDRLDWEARHSIPASSNHAYLARHVTFTPNVGQKAHLFGHIESDSPEINDVSARA